MPSDRTPDAGTPETSTAPTDRRVLDRRAFLQLGAAGLAAAALPTPAFAARARRRTTTTAKAAPALARTALLRVGVDAPAIVSDPTAINTAGQRLATALLGDHLCATDASYHLVPRLATSWTTNSTGTEWTFALRPGVTFHDGTPLGADDVVATFRRLLASPATAGPLHGLLAPTGVTIAGPLSVKFRLLAPNGSFPYLVSNEHPGAVVTPAKWRPTEGAWFVGTGAWRAEPATPDAGADELRLTRAATSWRATLPSRIARVVLVPLVDDASAAAAISSGDLDVAVGIGPETATSFTASGGAARVQATRTSAHPQIHMRTDASPFSDPRTRQALAMAIDRDQLIRAHMFSFADVGDDSPLAPAMPFVASKQPRTHDVAQAKALLRAAGQRRGFDVALATSDAPRDLALADLIAKDAADVGIRISIVPSPTYLDGEWLTTGFGLTTFGHRINTVSALGASLSSDGLWNAAHYRRSAFDNLARRLASALDLATQQATAAAINDRLQRDTPVIIPYFAQRTSLIGLGLGELRVTAVDQLDG